jgi:hypothetical protein
VDRSKRKRTPVEPPTQSSLAATRRKDERATYWAKLPTHKLAHLLRLWAPALATLQDGPDPHMLEEAAARLEALGTIQQFLADAIARADRLDAPVLLHSQEARKRAQAGMPPRSVPRVAAAMVAEALRAEPASKARTRAAAHSPRPPARSRTRKATR